MSTWPIPEPMQRALALASEAAVAGEVPIGAVVVKDGAIIGEGRNAPREGHDPTAHAEIIAIRSAAKALGNERLTDCELWVTLEPCAMCAGAIAHARLAKLYYGASDPKGGGVEHGARVFEHPQALHRPEVYAGIGESEAAELLRGFFEERR
ncbi:tRNA adenosine(34) deaminase TadA [Qipengyuania sp. DGS5-3]|uniref:tRNA adenosine(34) deaminase TadA n=1 Tax=Qipengyuania sp. DGS5-3 TaxID=3349632 RepID=UPI0036D20EAF